MHWAAEAAVYGELWRLWEAREQVLNTWLVRLYVPATQRTAPVYEVDAMYAEVKAVSGAKETVWAACRDFDDVMIRCRRRLMDISDCGALSVVLAQVSADARNAVVVAVDALRR